MNIATYGFIVCGIFLNALAQLLLKSGSNAVGAIYPTAENWLPIAVKLASQPPILGGLFCYVISVAVWIVGLSRINVTIAYPMLSLGYVINAFGAWYFLGETLTFGRLFAILIIISGVVLLVNS